MDGSSSPAQRTKNAVKRSRFCRAVAVAVAKGLFFVFLVVVAVTVGPIRIRGDVVLVFVLFEISFTIFLVSVNRREYQNLSIRSLSIDWAVSPYAVEVTRPCP
jgi:hypothetical protein